MNYEKAVTDLLEKFMKLGHEVSFQSKSELVIKTASGQQHNINVRFLNLDDARSINILKSDFNYELLKNQWILLVGYMHDLEPVSYLIPTKVFETPNEVFVDNEQPDIFRHMSNWEIKVFGKGIPELKKYDLDESIKQFV